jgi:hypothetical protein
MIATSMSDKETDQLNNLLYYCRLGGHTESLSDNDVRLARHEVADRMIARFTIDLSGKTLSVLFLDRKAKDPCGQPPVDGRAEPTACLTFTFWTNEILYWLS